MRKDERDTIRLVLEAALKNLSVEAADGEAASESTAMLSDRGRSSVSSEAPVILIVAGDSRPRLENTRMMGLSNADETQDPANPSSRSSGHSERKVSHPGLERFKMVDAAPNGPAPKACFMEPGRACVNSGACEMRGF
jgi:hypothetical protein